MSFRAFQNKIAVLVKDQADDLIHITHASGSPAPAVIVYKRARIIPFLAPYLPTRMSTYISGYQPLQSYSFADQAAAGMSSSSFDVEGQNMASGSWEGRVGLDSEGVEEIRRIM